eukprot:CAMPEP_0176144392 /NCGR_PEP_ID=MMETSP0120_2-20121206/73515_1 /TAXON_ID=160619 /ORGANISM="Kryptoperidinium foliaceum, Strain CCMP 1326" /LENGTH=38 /DNA_ID= /DNA_START= /DNA_END= /DNA_ORIENTATION=
MTVPARVILNDASAKTTATVQSTESRLPNFDIICREFS